MENLFVAETGEAIKEVLTLNTSPMDEKKKVTVLIVTNNRVVKIDLDK
jgi:hypothetical protein